MTETAKQPKRLLPTYAQIRGNGMVWTYDTRFEALLKELMKVNLRNLKGDPRCRIVKTGPARTVYNFRFLDGPVQADVFIKQYHLPELFDKVRYMLRPSKGQVEWDTSRAVAGLDVACPVPVAVAERRVMGYLSANFFVTVTEQHALPLDYFLRKNYLTTDTRAQRALRDICLEEFTRFIFLLHEKGIMHRDFHPGNILIKRIGGGKATFAILDMHSVNVRPGALNIDERLANLAQLNQFFSQASPRTDRLRFFKIYSRLSGFDEGQVKRYARQIESRTRRANKNLWASRDKRSVEDNKYFEKVRFGSFRGHVDKEYASGPLIDYLSDPERFFHDVEALRSGEDDITSSQWDPKLRLDEKFEGTRIIKDSRSTTLVETNFSLGDHFEHIVVKRFNARSTRSKVRRLFRASRALRAWRLGHSLLVRGLPTPRPLAAVEKRRLGFLGESYLVTEKVVNSLNLYQVFKYKLGHPLGMARREFKHKLIVRTALLVRKLHQMGYSQRDLKAQNILVQPTGRQPTAVNLYLIDMDGVHEVGHLTTEQRAKNLARLNASFFDMPAVSMTDRLRFLRSYLTGQELASGKLRVYWKLIGEFTEAKLASWRQTGKLKDGVIDYRMESEEELPSEE